MLAALLTACFACAAPQEPVALAAVAVRGDAELSPAAAYASARTRVDEHLRGLWRERADRAVTTQRPFWLPNLLAEEAVRRWLVDLPIAQMVAVVDREDRERAHEFGNSWQTTLWVAEDPQKLQRGEERLRGLLRRLERDTLARFGGIAAGWTVLVVALGWIDRLSRGYMTGRLQLAGLCAGVAVPVVAFLV
ncbi:MAG: hypothetical protein JNK15_21055 [Planctomycetes bacterium]|nr:hypothetical protein [Planctomycetota bacterium]